MQEAVDLRAVHPEQQLGVVDGEPLAGGGVGGGQAPVDPADAGPGAFGGFGGAVGEGADEVGGAQQPAPGVGAEVAVLHDPADGARVQGLEVERADPGDPHDRVAVALPGDGRGPVEPRVGPGRRRCAPPLGRGRCTAPGRGHSRTSPYRPLLQPTHARRAGAGVRDGSGAAVGPHPVGRDTGPTRRPACRAGRASSSGCRHRRTRWCRSSRARSPAGGSAPGGSPSPGRRPWHPRTGA